MSSRLPFPPGMVAPRTKVVLKRKVDDIQWVVVAEDHVKVRDLVNNATERLVTLTAVRGMQPHPFHVAPDAVASVEEWS
jgi:hypothetical protein